MSMESGQTGACVMEASYRHILPDGAAVVFCSGWLDAPADAVVFCLDANEANPVKPELVFYRRADVEAKFGLAQRQAGHGFACVFALPGSASATPKIVIAGPERENMRVITIKPELVFAWEDLLERICGQSPSKRRLEKTLAHLAPLLARARAKAWPGLASLPVEETTFGKAPPNPQISIIVLAAPEPDAIFTQILAFTEEAGFASSCELIFIAHGREASEECLAAVQQACDLTGISAKWLEPACPLTPGEAFNLGASNASGEVLLFTHAGALPAQAGWLPVTLAFFRENQGGLTFTFTSPENSLVNMSASFGASKKQPGASLLAFSRADFAKSGGFDPAFLLPENTFKNLAARFQANGALNMADSLWVELNGFYENENLRLYDAKLGLLPSAPLKKPDGQPANMSLAHPKALKPEPDAAPPPHEQQTPPVAQKRESVAPEPVSQAKTQPVVFLEDEAEELVFLEDEDE